MTSDLLLFILWFSSSPYHYFILFSHVQLISDEHPNKDKQAILTFQPKYLSLEYTSMIYPSTRRYTCIFVETKFRQKKSNIRTMTKTLTSHRTLCRTSIFPCISHLIPPYLSFYVIFPLFCILYSFHPFFCFCYLSFLFSFFLSLLVVLTFLFFLTCIFRSVVILLGT